MIYQIAALVILSVFYGCYFLKMFVQRKKGIRSDQIGQGKVGFVKFVEVTMKIATLLVPAAEVISILLNTTCFSAPLRICGGVGFCDDHVPSADRECGRRLPAGGLWTGISDV